MSNNLQVSGSLQPAVFIQASQMEANTGKFLENLRKDPFYVHPDELRQLLDDSLGLWMKNETTGHVSTKLRDTFYDVLLTIETEDDEAVELLNERLEALAEIDPENRLAILSHGYWLSLSTNNKKLLKEFEGRIVEHVKKHPKLVEKEFSEEQLFIDMNKLPAEYFHQEEANKVAVQSNSSFGHLWPAAGLVAGTAIGAIGNFFARTSSGACKAGNKLAECNICHLTRENGILGTINAAKQMEIKTFALLAPLALLTANIAYKTFKREESSSATEALKREVKQISGSDVLKTVALTAGAIATNLLMSSFVPAGFDPSGHVMLKYAATKGVITAIDYLDQSGQKNTSKVAGAVIATTDALFMANTSYCFHTPSEVAAGAAFVLGLDAAINLSVNLYGRMRSLVVA